MRRFFPGLCLLLAACNSITPIGNEGQGDKTPAPDAGAVQPLNPDARPVTIGESGASFDACAARAVVSLAGDRSLSVRAAPFDQAKPEAELANGRSLFVCTRSIDQRWLGVVVPPGDPAQTDCGVSERVQSVRPYTGPCLSGWVSNAFVEFTGN